MNISILNTVKHIALKSILFSLPLGGVGGGLLLCGGLTSCMSNEDGTIDLSGYTPEPEVTLNYQHPCALYDSTQFENVKKQIAAGTLNAKSSEEWQALLANKYTTLNYTATPHQQIVRGSATGTVEGVENYSDAMKDAAAAYQDGLIYLLNGNTQYADKAVEILNAWKNKCTEVTANDNNYYLAAGVQGFTFALAAEEVSVYWKNKNNDEFNQFKEWIVNVFGDKNYKFLSLHGSPNCNSPKHYMSNWDMVNLCSYFQIGILTEDDDIIKFCTNYYTKSGDGLGALSNIRIADYTFTCPDGTTETITQAQESGRDQGHATMAIVVSAQLAQAAWALYQNNPSYADLDFFAANDNQLLHMAEYNAMANLKSGSHEDITVVDNNGIQGGSYLYSESAIPFTVAGPWCTGNNHEAAKQQTVFGSLSRGQLRPGYEIFWAHYKNTAGHYFTERYANVQRPECGAGDARYGSNSGAFDQIGWGTLMLYTGE